MSIEFTLGFKEFIGRKVSIIDDGEYDYLSGELIGDRSYYGTFEGSSSDREGIYFFIEDTAGKGHTIKMSNETRIIFH